MQFKLAVFAALLAVLQVAAAPAADAVKRDADAKIIEDHCGGKQWEEWCA
ncbi:hypothetical protein BXZ70DRAFT_1007260 [Cristinia sonorae]|uniref:Uncharacterized protein n=1 Tax=Cristinia sonorae TaxID=1940300 RepID=A0A8K0UQY3_9AGAR|nr:hypothetical protein BXZ70DRAFT_1007260 [Cristinia sonorae]